MLENLLKIINSPKLSIVRYAFVGVLGTAVDVAALWAFVEIFGMAILPATTLAFVLAVVNNYILNKIWTFNIKEKNHLKFFSKFLTVSLVGLALTLAIMYLLVNILGVNYLIAKLMTSMVVVMWNFLTNKFWTFRIRTYPEPKKLADDAPFLSVVIPAYNESERLPKTLQETADWLAKQAFTSEIIVVDDGSADKTSEIAQDFLSKIKNGKVITLKQNVGKGGAVAAGMLAAAGHWGLFMDADGSSPVSEIEKLLPYAKTENDIVIGSRHTGRENIKQGQSEFRKWIGRFGNGLIQAILLPGIDDTQCGFKLFPHNLTQEIFVRQKIKRWGFDFEALAIGRMYGAHIHEVPVTWNHVDGSQFSPVSDSLKTFLELVMIKINIIFQRYK